jgi:hypothetical protein
MVRCVQDVEATQSGLGRDCPGGVGYRRLGQRNAVNAVNAVKACRGMSGFVLASHVKAAQGGRGSRGEGTGGAARFFLAGSGKSRQSR